MRKLIASIVLGAAVVAANAQNAVEGTKFSDNWSIGVNVGGTTPLTHSAFFKNMRAVWGVGLGKQITPVLGMDIEAMASINTTPSRTAIDNTNLSLLGTVNLNNLFGTYKGVPRLFEVETVTGIGWLRYLYNGQGDNNSLSTKLGLNFNFNLGKEKAWTLAFKPALVYDMNNNEAHNVSFNANSAAWEFTAGLKYHFKSSNGKRYFTIVKPCNQAEIDALNGQINDLRREANNNADALKKANRKAADLKKALDDCESKASRAADATGNKKSLESIVTFRQDVTTVVPSQIINVERVASYLKKHENATVSIKGYASPEGTVEVNTRVAQKRAESVKNLLVNKYQIAADRITAEGQGVGNLFEKATWNRVCICTIND